MMQTNPINDNQNSFKSESCTQNASTLSAFKKHTYVLQDKKAM